MKTSGGVADRRSHWQLHSCSRRKILPSLVDQTARRTCRNAGSVPPRENLRRPVSPSGRASQLQRQLPHLSSSLLSSALMSSSRLFSTRLNLASDTYACTALGLALFGYFIPIEEATQCFMAVCECPAKVEKVGLEVTAQFSMV